MLELLVSILAHILVLHLLMTIH